MPPAADVCVPGATGLFGLASAAELVPAVLAVAFGFNFSYTLKTLRSDCGSTAALTAAASVGSTLKASAIHDVAISTDSASSDDMVPSFREDWRKSTIDSARRFLVSRDCDRVLRSVNCHVRTMLNKAMSYIPFSRALCLVYLVVFTEISQLT